ncbi:MAG TPA: RluA family pseudouridine synthase [Pseudolabrys sp.]|nr:RluA family pseudouridine synthase [Pseudolabrys sp.]
MSRGKSGPRQPGGGRQQAGPRHQSRQARRQSFRHPEVRPQRAVARALPGGAGAEGFPASGKVHTVSVTADESGMRVDRFFEARFPGLSFSHIQRIIRKGEVRVNGKRTQPKARLDVGQSVRIPPLKIEAPAPRDDAPAAQKDRAFLKSITLYEDADVMVLNKPMGLAVQGGSGTTRHIDGMLGALRGPDGQRPRLVHRLDKDTAGCLLVAKTRFAATALAKTFRSRSARKIYWALVAGVPKPRQGRISTFLAKEEREEDSFMRIAAHGEKGASHAVTYYAVVETAAQRVAWLSLKPVTGRTHQLRAHMAHINHAIVGDPKYFNKENWELPGGIQSRLHLLARRIAVPHPRGGVIDVSAPLPPHMEQSWNLLGFDAKRYDPIEEAPEE